MPLRRGLGLRPVNSLKHVVNTEGTTVIGVQSVTPVVIAVDNPALASPEEVMFGSTVHSIFLSVEVMGTTPYSGNEVVYMIVFKNPGNNLAIPDPHAVGVHDNKKFVLHQEMTMVGPINTANVGEGFPRTMFKGVVRIPRGYKRMGSNDRLVVVVANAEGETTGKARWCIQCIYKEFR